LAAVGFDIANVTTTMSRAVLASKSDKALVALAQDGSEVAFSAIVGRYRRSLHCCCRRFLSDHDAQDAVQQTFVRALGALRSGSEVRELRPWLHRIARNVALNEVAARPAVHAELSEECEDLHRSGEVERRAELRAALAAMASLPGQQRNALARSVAGENSAAIAKELGVSEVAARQILHRARTTIRAAVHAVMPPPVLWLARRLAAVAERLPAPPPSIEPFVPKVAAAIAAATLVAAPASLIHASAHAQGKPLASMVSSAISTTARQTAAASGAPAQGSGSPSAAPEQPVGRSGPGGPGGGGAAQSMSAGGAPGGGQAVRTSSGSSRGASPADRGGGTATTPDPNAAPPGSTPASTDQTAPDPSAVDPSATDPSASAPATTDPASAPPTTDPASTDPASAAPPPTDPAGSAPATPDPASADPASTDPTPTDPSPPAP
jgi:RNA polymerase sigma factor (sigma-70 family)